jgi:hypothetical protein
LISNDSFGSEQAAQDGFRQLLSEHESSLTPSLDVASFGKIVQDDPRWQALSDSKERETLLNERLAPLKKEADESMHNFAFCCGRGKHVVKLILLYREESGTGES